MNTQFETPVATTKTTKVSDAYPNGFKVPAGLVNTEFRPPVIGETYLKANTGGDGSVATAGPNNNGKARIIVVPEAA